MPLREFPKFVKELFGTEEFIPLHEPRFVGREKEYVMDTINSTFVSSVGQYVDSFEEKLAVATGVSYAVAVSNGTSALHVSLVAVGVSRGDEVITQSLTFVATCNAISYCGADPIFVDVDRKCLGMSFDALKSFLDNETKMKDGLCINKTSGAVIRACVPMHTFGQPVRDMEDISRLCDQHGIVVVEDSAESLGSTLNGKQTCTFGRLAAVSFNGNKIITTGGGGAVLTNDEALAKKIKHLTTTAKVPHPWHYEHDMVGYNYRMPNLNAALGCAQLEKLEEFIVKKRQLALKYENWFKDKDANFLVEGEGACSNYWLNAIILNDRAERDQFLEITNKQGVMTRPIWIPMHKLKMFSNCQAGDMQNTEWLEDRLVNIPSSVIL